MRFNCEIRLKIFFVSLGFLTIAWCTRALVRHHSSDSLRDLIDRGLAALIGQKHEDGKNYPAYFKEYALADKSNDLVADLSLQEIILRSGYDFEDHFVTSDDGYITNLVRIINPLAQKRRLKGPPVMLLSGGISDQGIWVWASPGQHHPEKWPRTPADGPISSWNRSLGFVLANNGYDVWLVGTRGSNELNSGHKSLKRHRGLLDVGEAGRSNSRDEPDFGSEDQAENEIGSTEVKSNMEANLWQRLKYWDYSMDELAHYELPRQIDRVLTVTGAKNVTLMPISFSSLFTLISLAANTEYQKRLHNSVVFMPIINNLGTNKLLASFHKRTCRALPIELGTILYTEVLFSKTVRGIISKLSDSLTLRYTLFKALTVGFTGPSYKYQTLLEPAVVAKVMLPSAFKEIQHYCQQVNAGHPHRYDFGSKRNMLVYGSPTAPSYNLSLVDFGTWLVMSGSNDMLSTSKSARQYIAASKTAPVEHIVVGRYNHLDMIAALDNDVRVNLPVLNFLDRFHIAPVDS